MADDSTSNLRDFNKYNFPNQKWVLAEYIWIDGTGITLRSKTKTYFEKITKLEQLEWWTYDGSSCYQASTENSEIYIKPVFFCPDPFRGGDHVLVMCETFLMDKKTPAKGNFRHITNRIMTDAAKHDPWFGIEQEYFLFTRKGTTSRWPLGWPEGGFPYPQGRYYCAIGDYNTFGRSITEAHIRCCLYSGLHISGLNAEVAPGQWEFQVGIAKGIEAADHLWIARYILFRLGEEFGVDINLECKPIKGDWNGSGCHTNYSTNETRAVNGLEYIRNDQMKKLAAAHVNHITLYGEGNKDRLTGYHETSSMKKFTFAEGNRGTSVRIPVFTLERNSGYYEDRRPASNMDPYLVTGILVDTTVLDSKYTSELLTAYKNFKGTVEVNDSVER
jgi:glutamine synthetase